MINVGNIYDGWKNSINKENLSDEQKAVVEFRLSKCGACIFKKEKYTQKILETIIDGIFDRQTTQGEFKGFSCGICGCLLEKKSRSFNDECPLDPNRHFDAEGTPYQKRWGKASFDKEGKMLTGLN